jgi:hypothetical protein
VGDSASTGGEKEGSSRVVEDGRVREVGEVGSDVGRETQRGVPGG